MSTAGEAKLLEWASKHGFSNVLYGPDGGSLTTENKAVEAGRDLIRQCAEIALQETLKWDYSDMSPEEISENIVDAILREFGLDGKEEK